MAITAYTPKTLYTEMSDFKMNVYQRAASALDIQMEYLKDGIAKVNDFMERFLPHFETFRLKKEMPFSEDELLEKAKGFIGEFVSFAPEIKNLIMSTHLVENECMRTIDFLRPGSITDQPPLVIENNDPDLKEFIDKMDVTYQEHIQTLEKTKLQMHQLNSYLYRQLKSDAQLWMSDYKWNIETRVQTKEKFAETLELLTPYL